MADLGYNLGITGHVSMVRGIACRKLRARTPVSLPAPAVVCSPGHSYIRYSLSYHQPFTDAHDAIPHSLTRV